MIQYFGLLVGLCILLAGCTPKQTVVETAVQQNDQVATLVAEMRTATVEAMPKATRTPVPTRTPTPSPIFDKEEKTLDKILSGWDTIYSFPVIQITGVELKRKVSIFEPKYGYGFLRVDLSMNNKGEAIAELGSKYFIVAGDNGVLYEDPAVLETSCEIQYVVDVLPGGFLKGCVYFEVPVQRHYTLYYAPYELGRLDDDRSLKWEITGLR